MLPYSKIKLTSLNSVQNGSRRRLQSGKKYDQSGKILGKGHFNNSSAALDPDTLLAKPENTSQEIFTNMLSSSAYNKKKGQNEIGAQNINFSLSVTGANNSTDEPDMAALLLNQQSTSILETHNDSKLLQGSASVQHNYNESQDPLLIPTMLEVEFAKHSVPPPQRGGHHTQNQTKKPTSRSRSRSHTQRNGFKSAVKTEGLSGSSMGQLTSLQGIVPNGLFQIDLVKSGLSPKRILHMSPEIDDQEMQEEFQVTVKAAEDVLIEDINKNFSKLKNIFPNRENKLNIKNGVVVRSSAKHNNNNNLLPPRASSSFGHAQAHHTQQVTSRERAMSANRIKQFSRKSGVPLTSGFLTSNVPTQRKTNIAAQSSSSFPASRQVKYKKTKNGSSVQRLLSHKDRFAKNSQKIVTSPKESIGQNNYYTKNEPPISNVTVMNLDSKQMLKLSKSQYSRKENKTIRRSAATHTTRQKTQGPIQRLKSAAIRSVFDKGENYYQENDASNSYAITISLNKAAMKHNNQKKPSPLRPMDRNMSGTNLSSNLSDPNYHQLSTKGQQVALPTYVMTPQLQDYNSEYNMWNQGQQHPVLPYPFGCTYFEQTSAYQQVHGHNDQGDSPNSKEQLMMYQDGDEHDYNKITTQLVDDGYNCTIESSGGGNNGTGNKAEFYQHMMVNHINTPNAVESGLLSSNVLTPVNEQILPSMQYHKEPEDKRQQDTGLYGGNFATGETRNRPQSSIQRDSSGQQQNQKEYGDQNDPDRNIQVKEVIFTDQSLKDFVQNPHQQRNVIQIGSSSHESAKKKKQVVSAKHEPYAAERKGSNSLDTSSNEKKGGDFQSDHRHDETESVYLKATSSNHNGIMKLEGIKKGIKLMVKADGTGGQKSSEMFSGNQTLALASQVSPDLVAVTEINRGDIGLDTNDRFNSQNAIDGKNLHQMSASGVAKSQIDFKLKQLGNSTVNLMLSQPDSKLKQHQLSSNNANEESNDGILSENFKDTRQQSVLSSTALSQPQMVSKLHSDKHLKEQSYQLGAGGQTNNREQTDQQLLTASFKPFETYDSVKVKQQQQLENARQDLAQMKELKQQIDEDYMQMVDLTQGLQSGMIKIDPQYMNKAIVQKIQHQYQNWQLNELKKQKEMLQRLGQQTQAPKITFKSNSSARNPGTFDYRTGLQEMQELDTSLRKRPTNSTLTASFGPISDLQAQINQLQHGQSNGQQIIVKINKENAQAQLALAQNMNSSPNLQDRSNGTRLMTQHQPLSSTMLTRISEDGNPKDRRDSTSQNGFILRLNDETTPEKSVADQDHSFILLDNAIQGTDQKYLFKEQLSIEQTNRTVSKQAKLTIEKDGAIKLESAPESQMITFQKEDGDTREVKKTTIEVGESEVELTLSGRLERRLMTFEQGASNKDLQEVKTIESNKQKDKPEGQNQTQVDLNQKLSQTAILELELRKLQDMDFKARDGTGVLSQSWLDHRINVMKPVKKFVNLNQQTAFAQLEPSLLQKQSESQLAQNNSNVIQNRTSLQVIANLNEVKTYKRGQSELQVRPQSPHYNTLNFMAQSIANKSIGTTTVAQTNENQQPGRIRPQTSKMLIRDSLTNNAKTRESSEFTNNYAAANSLRHYHLERNISQGMVKESKPDRISAMTSQTLGGHGHGERGGGYISGADSHVRVSYENVVPNNQNNTNHGKDSKGPLGQQTRFNNIDVVKLTGDKALNRHINGQVTLEYDQIRLQAQESSKQMLLAQQRQKTMIPQAEANQRSMRNLKQSFLRSSKECRNKNKNNNNTSSYANNNRSSQQRCGSMLKSHESINPINFMMDEASHQSSQQQLQQATISYVTLQQMKHPKSKSSKPYKQQSLENTRTLSLKRI